MHMDDEGKITVNTEGQDPLVTISLVGNKRLMFFVPGVVPYWISKRRARRANLTQKLRELADSCEKCEYPFEDLQ